jgi:hypothetical protein
MATFFCRSWKTPCAVTNSPVSSTTRAPARLLPHAEAITSAKRALGPSIVLPSRGSA